VRGHTRGNPHPNAITKGIHVPPAVLVIDKPRGPTSHDVVAKLRRVLRTKHIGHCGTLDPMATGVLVVAIEEATKLVPWLTADDKAYVATVRLGAATDSLDADGTLTIHAPISADLRHELERLAQVPWSAPNATMNAAGATPLVSEALEAERQRTLQVPPAVSAVRIGGQRAHELTRQGRPPELEARSCKVHSLHIIGVRVDPEPEIDLAVEAGKGFFVRSLARDIAAALGTVGYLTALRRTRSGAFTAQEAVSIEERAEALLDAALPLPIAASRALATNVLTEAGARAVSCGQRVHLRDIAPPHSSGPCAWLSERGELLAIGTLDDERDAASTSASESHAESGSESKTGRVLRGFAAAQKNGTA